MIDPDLQLRIHYSVSEDNFRFFFYALFKKKRMDSPGVGSLGKKGAPL